MLDLSVKNQLPLPSYTIAFESPGLASHTHLPFTHFSEFKNRFVLHLRLLSSPEVSPAPVTVNAIVNSTSVRKRKAVALASEPAASFAREKAA
jgi:hypothetical protein